MLIDSLYYYKAHLIRIIDGDTIVVDIDLGIDMWLRKQHCRLLGINCPEPKGISKIQGLAATNHLTKLIENKSLIIRTKYDRSDSFDRLLVDVWADNLNINKQMVKDGHAVQINY